MAQKETGREATKGVIEGNFVLGVGMPSGKAPEGWRWTRLLDIARLESGHTPSRRKPEYWGGDVPWIGIKDVTANHGRTIENTVQHTNALGIRNSAARILPKNTVCLSRTASVGYVVVMGQPMATSQDFANWVCSDHLDFRFLKFALLAERSSMNRFSHGSTHQTIYYPELKAFHICIPSIDEQHAISDTLQALDDKIELNRRMCGVLEDMARALYRSWFVDFDPVHARAAGRPPAHMPPATAALFPDRFGENGLPEGWEIGSLSVFSELAPEKWSKKNAPGQIEYVDLSNTNWGRIDKTTAYDWETAPSRARLVLRPGDTIVGTVRPGNGAYSLIAKDGLTGSTGFAVLRPKSDRDEAFVYCVATSRENIDSLANLADGGAYPAVRPDAVLQTDAAIAPDGVMTAFSEFVLPFLEQLSHNNSQNQTLAALRDTLLPKLMSGELRIKDAEAQIEKVI